MSERSYNQYCGIAYALDIIGERWTLLIIRELILGPRRYKDLLDALPGIGTNLLSDRLKKLSEYEIITQKELPPPAASTVYALTATGKELQPIIERLGSWGSHFLGHPDKEDTFNPRWLLLAMKNRFHPERAKSVDKAIEFRIDDEVLYAQIENNSIVTSQGFHPDPDLIIQTDSKSFIRLLSDADAKNELLKNGSLRLEGEAKLFDKLSDWFETES